MSKFGSIRKLPSGKYQARYRVNGVEYRAPATFPTRPLARQWLTVQQAKLIQGVISDVPESKPVAPLLGDIAVNWLDWIDKTKSPDTYRSYRSKWQAHIATAFAGVRADELTRQDIITWDKRKDWVSPQQRTNTFRILSAFLNWLVRQEIITDSPLKNIPYAEGGKRQRKITIATPKQLQQIKEYMPPQLRIAVDLGGWCAMRFGEVAGLERRDVDLTRGTVTISRATHRGANGEETVGATKTKASNRTIHMPPFMVETMAAHLEAYVGSAPDSPIVFNISDNTRRLSNKHLHKYYAPAVAAIGLPGFRFHDLRHTGLTLIGQQGATLAELMARGGHSSPDTVMIYQTATLERDKALVAGLGEYGAL